METIQSSVNSSSIPKSKAYQIIQYEPLTARELQDNC